MDGGCHDSIQGGGRQSVFVGENIFCVVKRKVVEVTEECTGSADVSSSSLQPPTLRRAGGAVGESERSTNDAPSPSLLSFAES